MTLYAPANEAAIVLGQPRLHAFIIGVADYPHLLGGGGAPAGNQLQLGQVTTPQYTAAAIAEWFAQKYNNPNVPLGSIELLISKSKSSPATATRSVPATDPATMSEIRKAFNRWEGRAGSHPGNIAVFYFCGHGVLKTNHFLLPSDFGDPAEREKWENCIEFDALRVGMSACKARTQLFFVDACRETPPGVLKEMPIGHRLISADETTPIPTFGVYNAAAEKQQAFGPPDGPTYFAEALLAALRIGAESANGASFAVDTFSLANALAKLTVKYASRYKQKLTFSPTNFGVTAIQHVPGPSVLAVVGCSTDLANKAAEITLDNGATQVRSLVGQSKPMYEVVEAGRWNIDVSFPTGAFAGRQFQQVDFRPPVFEGVDVP